MNPSLPAPVPALSDAVFALTLALLLLARWPSPAWRSSIPAWAARARPRRRFWAILAIVAVAAIVFALVGASFAGTLPGVSGSAGFTFHAAGKPWNWLGQGPFLLRGLGAAAPQSQLALLFEFLAVAMAALFPGARERIAGVSRPAAPRQRFWRLSSFLSPRTGSGTAAGSRNWASNFALGAGFLDAGGAATVHAARRPQRAGRGLDRRPAQGQISQRGPFDRHARPQRRLRALRLPAGPGRLAGLERRRRNPLAARAARRAARHRDQYAALRLSGARAPPSPSPASASANPTPASAPTAGWPAWSLPAPAPPSSRRSSQSLSASSPASSRRCMVELLELALSIDDPSGAITVHAAAGLWGLARRGPLCAAARPIPRPIGRHRRAARPRAAAGLSALLRCSTASFPSASIPTASASAWTCTNSAAAPIRSS